MLSKDIGFHRKLNLNRERQQLFCAERRLESARNALISQLTAAA
jgi:hypothetical protein